MFKFNGYNIRDFVTSVNDVSRPVMPKLTAELIETEGGDGAIVADAKREKFEITVDVTVASTTKQLLRKKIRALAGMLNTGKKTAPLVFDDETNIEYQAICTGCSDPSQKGAAMQFSITFLVPNPTGKDSVDTIINFNMTSGLATANIDSTAPSLPVVEIDVKGDLAWMSYFCNGAYVALGEIPDVQLNYQPRKSIVLRDECSSLNGWQSAGTVINDGVVTGTMTADGSFIKPTAVGTGPVWHGPAVKKALGEELEDFEVNCRMYLDNKMNKDYVQRTQFYGLDANGEVLFFAGLRDTTAENAINGIDIWIAGQWYEYKMTGGYLYNYTPIFSGIITVGRKNKTWYYYIRQTFANGMEYAGRYNEINNIWNIGRTGKLAQVELHSGSYSGWAWDANFAGKFDWIEVWKHNVDPTKKDYIATAGDKITIDHESGKVFLNGSPRMDLLDPTSEFFALPTGTTELQITPTAKLTSAKMKINGRWL